MWQFPCEFDLTAQRCACLFQAYQRNFRTENAFDVEQGAHKPHCREPRDRHIDVAVDVRVATIPHRDLRVAAAGSDFQGVYCEVGACPAEPLFHSNSV